ncbi:MAG: 4Fe-4S binding protein, partial [Anaerohalosphaera sp.]|nr:4Fe-4S binding protein [Anaerohalosphaera sp.]
MRKLRYLDNVVTLELDPEKCVGCQMCVTVCPHRVFAMNGSKAQIIDRDGCMECGACAANCPVQAISVTPGVGCASYIIQTW